MKIKCKLLGTDGNAFSIIAKVSSALKRAGQQAEAKKFQDEAFKCESYDQLLQLAMKTVEVS
jgi:menaquinone-dependent protoporphyrinogen IX oxidase